MPLLGRHKSLPGAGANQSSDRSAAGGAASAAGAKEPPVCESPLFGVRRQLPVATCSAAGERPARAGGASGSAAIPSSRSLSSRLGGGGGGGGTGSPSSSGRAQLRQQQSGDGQLGSTLSSIPAQISRQQIHYAFSIMDTNSDGLVGLSDLSQMLANLGVPIDEAILSHVLAPVSKRGDHLISESEFLDWIGNFIQVQADGEPALGSPPAPRSPTTGGGRAPARRSASAHRSPASLAAQSPEAQVAISQQLRQRRGSGSGLALVRSLSSSASPGAGEPSASEPESAPATAAAAAGTEAAAKRERLAQDQREARRDLKAAFCVFDLDGDGFITIDEVQQGLKLLGESWSQAELNQLFSQCGSGRARPGGAAPRRPDSSKQRISIDDFVQLLL